FAAYEPLPLRNGTKAAPAIANSSRFNPLGPGDDLVILIDNVRDEEFYTFQNARRLSRIGGFFSSTLNELFDRNIFTIDPEALPQSLGANPPGTNWVGPLPPIGTLTRECLDPQPRPFDAEATFAHEFQHELEYYADQNEISWVNEGLSMFTEGPLTGYDNTTAAPPAPATQSHTWGFLGRRN